MGLRENLPFLRPGSGESHFHIEEDDNPVKEKGRGIKKEKVMTELPEPSLGPGFFLDDSILLQFLQSPFRDPEPVA
jgi:hypothetical protein